MNITEINAEAEAKALVHQFMPELAYIADVIRKRYPTAKACALIYVDGIIKELKMLRKPEYTSFIAWDQLKDKKEADTWDGYERIEYWQLVRKHITQL